MLVQWILLPSNPQRIKSIHAIRRTFNSKLRCMGVSTVVAASMLGHTVQVNENNYTYDVASMDYKKKVMSEVWKKAEGTVVCL